MRINKYLASVGLGSRRKVEELILAGTIKVNGAVVRDLATDIDVDHDVVEFHNNIVKPVETKVYYVLNKPKNVLCSCSDGHGRRLVVDFVPGNPKVFPVGRLDYETEGLIILTNDGDFANSIIHPSKKISKTYEIVTNKKLTIEDKRSLEKGVLIDDQVTLPCHITTDIKIDSGYKRQITIIEGRNRQIRKMFDSVGHNVVSLKRIKIGGLTLGGLKVGKYETYNLQQLHNKIENK